MYSVFDDETVYTLPTGNEVIGSELKEDPSYNILKNSKSVVNIDGGYIVGIRNIDSLLQAYGLSSTGNINDDVVNVNSFIRKSRVKEAQRVDTFDSMLKVAKFLAITLTDEQALEVRDLYDEYQVDHAYKKDERFTYNGQLFKVNQDHTSQEQWVPGETGTESLYTSLEMGDNGYLNWQQPTGSHDAYNTGDIVNYKGELYKSLIDGNTWAPDVYPAGWEKYTEPTS